METGGIDRRNAPSDSAGVAARRPVLAILGILALGVYAIVGSAFACNWHFSALSLRSLANVASALGAGLTEGADEGAGPV